MNPFDAVYEIDAHHAAVLAEAFCASNDSEDAFWAILRFADARDGKPGGFYGAYLDGRHFSEYFDTTHGTFQDFCALREMAQAYRDDCAPHSQFYKLAI